MAEAVLFITSRGFGKVTDESEFATKGRGGKGVGGFKVTEESGPVVSAEHVEAGAGQRVLIVTAQGRCLMIRVDDLAVRSRGAGGVRLMSVEDDDAVVQVLV